MSESVALSARLYPHPFSREYWKQAASEFKKPRVLIFAALNIGMLEIAYRKIARNHRTA